MLVSCLKLSGVGGVRVKLGLLQVRPKLVRTVTNGSTHYDTLKIPRTASKSEIKAAYKRQVALTHPDVNPHDEKESHCEFCAVQEAFAVLSDDKSRTMYDRELRLREQDGVEHENVTSSTNNEKQTRHWNFYKQWYRQSEATKKQQNTEKQDDFFAKTNNSTHRHKRYSLHNIRGYKGKSFEQQALVKPLVIILFTLYSVQLALLRIVMSDDEVRKDKFLHVKDPRYDHK